MFKIFYFETGSQFYVMRSIPKPIALFLTVLIVAALILPTIISASTTRNTMAIESHDLIEHRNIFHRENPTEDFYEKVLVEAAETTSVKKVIVPKAPRLNLEIEFNKWLSLAQNGDSHAQRIIGYFFEKGEGVPANVELALSWYRKSAENGNGEAQWLLGNLLKDQVVGNVDDAEAKYWLTKAQGSGYGVKKWIGVICPRELMRIAKLKEKITKQKGA
jgi:hypothetical protein